MFRKKEKKLSEEDLKNWDSIKKTLDFKFFHKPFQINAFLKDKKSFNKKTLIENNTFRYQKNLKKTIEHGKILNNYQLEDIRIDKKILNLLKRGKIKPEKTLDLHGLTAVEAKIKAIEFTTSNFNLGLRLLLIITGKGKNKLNTLSKEGLKNGVLRNSLKSWLYDSDLRPNILGIISSHIRHGGEGAFYIYLKKNKIL